MDDPHTLAFLITLIILDSIFLGWVAGVTPGLTPDATPSLYSPKQSQNITLDLNTLNITNASAGIGGDFELYGDWEQNTSYGGWEATGTSNRIYLNNLHVNGYGKYDNTYRIANTQNSDFDVFISYPKGIITFGSSGVGNKKVILEVRGASFTIPTSIVAFPTGIPILSDLIRDDKTATKSYDINDFTIRTTYNETSAETEIYVDGQQIIYGKDLGTGFVYVGERVFGGLQVYGPGLILKNWQTTALSVTTSWYGDPITGFLNAAWNFFKTAFAFFVWDFGYPEEWQFVMNGMYLLFVRVPCYIALFIGIRLLRG